MRRSEPLAQQTHQDKGTADCGSSAEERPNLARQRKDVAARARGTEKQAKSGILLPQHKDSEEKSLFYKDTFAKIAPERRERILSTAMAEFAEQGYNAANVNVIARKAGVSVGSLYTYFASKEDLFLALVEIGREKLDEVMRDISAESKSQRVFDILERLFRVALDYSRRHRDLCRIYLDLSTEKLSPLAGRLAGSLESNYLEFYRSIIRRGIAAGEIRADLDVHLAAFSVDNLIVILQFSSSSSYYRERLVAYLGEEALEESAALAARISKHLHLSWATPTAP